MKQVRAITLAAFVLIPAGPTIPNMHAQACGRSFVDITVTDSEGKSVPGATIEIVTDAPGEYAVRARAGDAVTLSPRNNPSIKISLREAEEIIKLGASSQVREDICGNPLKQVVNSTKVTRDPDYVEGREFSVKNFGFCTTEGSQLLSLLKVSAPGYVTDYYVGSHLGGCRRTYKVVLNRRGRS